jgi:hypothetical protein
MDTTFKWIRRLGELVLVGVVGAILINLISEEIGADEQGWLHAIRTSRYVLWLIGIMFLTILIEVAATYLERRRPTITIEVAEHRFWGSGWAGDMPLLPLRFQVFLDIRNTGEAPGYINQFDLIESELGTDLLTVSDASPSCHATGGKTDGRRMDWPEKIEERISSVRCNIEAELNVTDPKEFAQRFSELKEYKLVLKYVWERANGATGERTIPVEGDYEDFKAHCIDTWERTNRHELALAAIRGELRAVYLSLTKLIDSLPSEQAANQAA